MRPSDHADLEETLRALEVLKERRASAARFTRLVRASIYGLLILIGAPLGIVVLGGAIQDEIGVWPIFFAVLYAGGFYLTTRMIYPKRDMPVSALSHHAGYRNSDLELIDEQIADYESRLKALQRADRD